MTNIVSRMKRDLWPLDAATTNAIGYLVAVYGSFLAGWFAQIWSQGGAR